MNAKLLITTLLATTLALPAWAQQKNAPDASVKETHAATKIASNWQKVPVPPLPAFTPAKPTRLELANGMVVFLLENHELPLISGSVKIRGGSNSEPASKAGLVELFALTWRTGGTEALTGDQLDDRLEMHAAKVESSSDGASTSLSFNCLTADFPEVFGTVADLLRHPAFRADKLELAKHEMNSGISRRNDESEEIASIQAEILGYGGRSPYARQPEYFTVANVSREDLPAWHRRHVTPNNIILAITGDFDARAVEALLHRTFDDWPHGEKIAPVKG